MSKLSKSERTRQFIIERTAPIFNVKGYEGTSMNDMTAATGLTKGSIYGNFENKQEVALAAFDHNLGITSGKIADSLARAESYTDKLMVYVKVYRNFIKGEELVKGGCPILNTAVEADDTNPALKDRAAKAIKRWKETIANLVTEGITAGEFKDGVDAAQTALSIVALIEGGIMIAKVTNHPSGLDKILNTVQQIIEGLKA